MANNPRVFLEIAVNFKTVGRIVIELFADTNGVTGENFRALRGVGGESSYGHGFTDTNFERKHDGKGILSMAANSDEDAATYGSQFILLLTDSPDLDGEQVAFGKVVDGFDVIGRVEEMAGNGLVHPSLPVTVADSGQVFPEPPPMVNYSVRAKFLVNRVRALHLKVAEMENALAKKQRELGGGVIQSMALHELLLAPLTGHWVPHEREGQGAGHYVPEEGT